MYIIIRFKKINFNQKKLTHKAFKCGNVNANLKTIIFEISILLSILLNVNHSKKQNKKGRKKEKEIKSPHKSNSFMIIKYFQLHKIAWDTNTRLTKK